MSNNLTKVDKAFLFLNSFITILAIALILLGFTLKMPPKYFPLIQILKLLAIASLAYYIALRNQIKAYQDKLNKSQLNKKLALQYFLGGIYTLGTMAIYARVLAY